VQNFVAIGQIAAKNGDFSIFQEGSRPPSWICDGRIWIIHERHLVVFITVQNLTGIDTV